MLRAWALALNLLIRIGIVQLPQQEQAEKLKQHHLDQNARSVDRYRL